MKRVFVLDPANQRRDQVAANLYACLRQWEGPCRVIVEDPKRTPEQNDKIQPMARDIARQILWAPVGRGPLKLSEKQWRHFFAGHIRSDALVLPRIDGEGIIVVGVGSSDLSKKEASDMVELMYAFGADRGVVWSKRVAA